MKIQFLYCTNPNMPDQGEYIIHEEFPRFRAKIVGDDLVLDARHDGEDVDYSGKLSRAKKWWYSFKNKSNERR